MSTEYGKMEFAVSFKPITAFPLDSRSYYESLSAAEAAAAGAVEAGSDAGTIHFGQIITVVENGTAQMYQVQPNGTLGEVGGKIEIDENQFVIDKETGKLNLLNFASAVEGAQPVKQNGKIVWVKPDTTTVEGLSTTVEALDSVVNGTEAEDGSRNEDGLVHRVAGLESSIKNVYSKEETEDLVNEEVSKKVHMTKKVVSSIDEMTEEDVMYLLPVEGATGEDIYKEYFLIDGEPKCYGDTSTDLKDYAKSADVTKEITEKIEEALENIEDGAQANKIDNVSSEFEISEDGTKTLSVKEISQEKIIGLPTALENISKGLMSDAERQKLNDMDENAEPNFIKSVNEDEFSVDASGNLVLKAVAQSKVTGLEDALANFVTKVDGKGLSTNDFTDDLKDKLDNIGDDAQENVIEIIKLGGTEASINNKTVEIPIATATALGLVKSSTANNEVTVKEDGTMEVNNLHVSKLVQDEDEVLILYGGDSTNGSSSVVA